MKSKKPSELSKLSEEHVKNLHDIEDVFRIYYPGLFFTDLFVNRSLIPFYKQISFDKLKEFMGYACLKLEPDPNASLDYFCGICWNSIRHDPEERDV